MNGYRTMVFIIVFSQYLRGFNIPFCSYKREEGCGCTGYPVFKLVPVSQAFSDINKFSINNAIGIMDVSHLFR